MDHSVSKVYAVMYDTRYHVHLENIRRCLMGFKQSMMIFQGLWLVKIDYSAENLASIVKKNMGDSNSVFVVEIGEDYSVMCEKAKRSEFDMFMS